MEDDQTHSRIDGIIDPRPFGQMYVLNLLLASSLDVKVETYPK